MRDLPVKLPDRMPAPKLDRRGSIWREALFFLIAFFAMFGGALIGFDWLVTVAG